MKPSHTIPGRLQAWHKVSTPHGKATLVGVAYSKWLFKLLLANGDFVGGDSPETFDSSQLTHIKDKEVRERTEYDLPGLDNARSLITRNTSRGTVLHVKFDATIAGRGTPIQIEATSNPDLAWQLAYAVAQENTAIETELSSKTYDRNAARSSMALKAIANPKAGFLDIYEILTNLFDYQALIEMPSYLTVNFNPTSNDTSTTQYIDEAANKWQASYDIFDVVTQIKTEKIAWELREYMETIPQTFKELSDTGTITDHRIGTEIGKIFLIRGAIIDLKDRRQTGYITQEILEDISQSIEFLKAVQEKIKVQTYHFSFLDNLIDKIMEVVNMKKWELEMK